MAGEHSAKNPRRDAHDSMGCNPRSNLIQEQCATRKPSTNTQQSKHNTARMNGPAAVVEYPSVSLTAPVEGESERSTVLFRMNVLAASYHDPWVTYHLGKILPQNRQEKLDVCGMEMAELVVTSSTRRQHRHTASMAQSSFWRAPFWVSFFGKVPSNVRLHQVICRIFTNFRRTPNRTSTRGECHRGSASSGST